MIENSNHAIAAGLIFVIAYALIASERIHRTIVAVAGSSETMSAYVARGRRASAS